MSLTDLAWRTRNSLLDFLWRQWAELGVAGSVRFVDNWMVDPEALLLFTMEVGRYDPRLFDEVVDWTVRNQRWISLQRLRNLSESWDQGSAKRGMVAFARLLNSLEKRNRWLAISQMDVPAPSEPVPFFLACDGNPVPVLGEADTIFAEIGFTKPATAVRGLSLGIPMDSRPGFIVRLRSLFGLGPRAEVVAYLSTHAGGSASEIARAIWYSRPPVQEILNDFVEGDFVLVGRRRSQKVYSLNMDVWRRILQTGGPLPMWVEWPALFRSLVDLLVFFAGVENHELSDYMQGSLILTQSERLQAGLMDTGIANPFAVRLDPANAPEQFESLVESLLYMLNEGANPNTAQTGPELGRKRA